MAQNSITTTRRAERLLVPAAFITALGNNIQLIAGALLMVRTEHTMLAVGWLFIAVAVPQALLSPSFGRLADRLDRRSLWIGCDLTSAVLALALPVWLTLGGAEAAGVYAANFALAVVGALFFPTSAALIKERVRPERVRRFNADYEMATQAGMLLSATVGGVAVQRFGAVPLLSFNAATFVVSALCLVAVGRRPDGVGDSGAVATAGRGAGVVSTLTSVVPTGRIPMGRLILLYAQGSVVVTVFNALLPKLVLGEWHRGAGTFGAVDAIGSLGFLAATAFYKVVGRRFGDLRVAVFGFCVCNTVFFLQPQFGPTVLAALVLGSAFVFGTARIASRNLLMTSVDEAHAGRAFGRANGVGLAATVVAMLLVATVTDHADTRYGFALTAGLGVVATVSAGLLLRSGKPLAVGHQVAPGDLVGLSPCLDGERPDAEVAPVAFQRAGIEAGPLREQVELGPWYLGGAEGRHGAVDHDDVPGRPEAEPDPAGAGEVAAGRVGGRRGEEQGAAVEAEGEGHEVGGAVRIGGGDPAVDVGVQPGEGVVLALFEGTRLGHAVSSGDGRVRMSSWTSSGVTFR